MKLYNILLLAAAAGFVIGLIVHPWAIQNFLFMLLELGGGSPPRCRRHRLRKAGFCSKCNELKYKHRSSLYSTLCWLIFGIFIILLAYPLLLIFGEEPEDSDRPAFGTIILLLSVGVAAFGAFLWYKGGDKNPGEGYVRASVVKWEEGGVVKVKMNNEFMRVRIAEVARGNNKAMAESKWPPGTEIFIYKSSPIVGDDGLETGIYRGMAKDIDCKPFSELLPAGN